VTKRLPRVLRGGDARWACGPANPVDQLPYLWQMCAPCPVHRGLHDVGVRSPAQPHAIIDALVGLANPNPTDHALAPYVNCIYSACTHKSEYSPRSKTRVFSCARISRLNSSLKTHTEYDACSVVQLAITLAHRRPVLWACVATRPGTPPQFASLEVCCYG